MEPRIQGSQRGEMLSNERSNWYLAVFQTSIAVGAFSQMTSEVEPGHMKQRDLALLKVEGLEAAQDHFRGSEKHLLKLCRA